MAEANGALVNKEVVDNAVSFLFENRDLKFYTMLTEMPAYMVEQLFGADSRISKATNYASKWLLEADVIDWMQKLYKLAVGMLGYLKAKGGLDGIRKFASLTTAIGSGLKLLGEFIVTIRYRLKHKDTEVKVKYVKKYVESNNAAPLMDALRAYGKDEARQSKRKYETGEKDANGKMITKKLEQKDIDQYKDAKFKMFRLVGRTIKAMLNPKGKDATAMAELYPKFWQFIRYSFWRFLPEAMILASSVIIGGATAGVATGAFITAAQGFMRSRKNADKSSAYFKNKAELKGMTKILGELANVGNSKTFVDKDSGITYTLTVVNVDGNDKIRVVGVKEGKQIIDSNFDKNALVTLNNTLNPAKADPNYKAAKDAIAKEAYGDNYYQNPYSFRSFIHEAGQYVKDGIVI